MRLSPKSSGEIPASAAKCSRTFSSRGSPQRRWHSTSATAGLRVRARTSFSHCSGHDGFGGALFQILRRFYGTDAIPFTFVSDEFNGVTRDNNGNVRPLLPRNFPSLSQAEEENGQSRIYLGIHWSFDKTEAIAQGRRVGNYVFDNAFVPRHPGRR